VPRRFSVEVDEQVVELGADVRAIRCGVVVDEVAEQVRGPHVRIVAEHQEQNPGEGHGDLVIPLRLVMPRLVGLFHRGIHARHELRGVLGLVLCLDIERSADLRQDGVRIEDDIEGQPDRVESGRELRVRCA